MDDKRFIFHIGIFGEDKNNLLIRIKKYVNNRIIISDIDPYEYISLQILNNKLKYESYVYIYIYNLVSYNNLYNFLKQLFNFKIKYSFNSCIKYIPKNLFKLDIIILKFTKLISIPFEIIKLQNLEELDFKNDKIPFILYDLQNLKRINNNFIKNKRLVFRFYFIIHKNNNILKKLNYKKLIKF